MLNQTVLVGRLVKGVELEKEGDKNFAIMTLAVPRSFKNENGEYEIDFFDCIIMNSIVENTANYCKKGDVVGVKGRLQSRTIENEDGTKTNKIELIAERITFLSSKKEEMEK